MSEAAGAQAEPGTTEASLAEQIVRGPVSTSKPLLLSGASDGADTLFGAAALRAGDDVVHFLGPGNAPSEVARCEQAASLHAVKKELIEHPTIVAALRDAATARGESDVSAWYESSRNFLQVRRVCAVYAVGYRAPDPAPALDIGGGTGFAAQFYVDRFRPKVDSDSGLGGESVDQCQLYFYDDGTPGWAGCKVVEATHKKWSKWEITMQAWVPMQGSPPPRPSGLYAGIGGTRLSPDGERAIAQVYECGTERAHS